MDGRKEDVYDFLPLSTFLSRLLLLTSSPLEKYKFSGSERTFGFSVLC